MKKVKLLFPVVVILASLMIGGCASTPAHESTGQYFDSSLITTKVKTKLADQLGAKSISKISVSTYKGTVTLRGSVKNAKQMGQALTIAGNTSGVKKVKNRLTIK